MMQEQTKQEVVQITENPLIVEEETAIVENSNAIQKNVEIAEVVETPVKERNTTPNWTKALLVLLIIAVLGIVLGTAVRERVNWERERGTYTLLLNDYQTQEGYLEPNDYVFGKNQKQINENLPIAQKYKFHTGEDSIYGLAFNPNSEVIKTSKGIAIGNTWDEFVNAYGDYIADDIVVQSSEKNETMVEVRNITINDFDREYIKTGKVILDGEHGNLSVRFSFAVNNGEIIYESDKISEARFEENNLMQRISMIFLFQKMDNESVEIQGISPTDVVISFIQTSVQEE